MYKNCYCSFFLIATPFKQSCTTTVFGLFVNESKLRTEARSLNDTTGKEKGKDKGSGVFFCWIKKGARNLNLGLVTFSSLR
jgi:hypothetical protein